MAATITIVTATRNRRAMLERALASAAREGTDNIQHVIVDGGSTDGTLEMLARHPHLEVISEPDRNLYDAWNKGIARARGDFIYLLNSDDEVVEGVFGEARRLAALHPEAELISGPVLVTRGNGAHTVLIDDARILDMRAEDAGRSVPVINGRFLSRRLLERVGKFDVRYNVVADRQFLVRALAAGAVNITTNVPLYRYHVHDKSLTLYDGPPSLAQAEENLRAAMDGLAEADDPALSAAYRHWHSWAAFYLARQQLREGQVRPAMATAAAAWGRDPLLPARVLPQIGRHLADRAARHGRELASAEAPERGPPHR